MHSGARKAIKLARRQEGEYLVTTQHLDVPLILGEFGRLCQKDPRQEMPDPEVK